MGEFVDMRSLLIILANVAAIAGSFAAQRARLQAVKEHVCDLDRAVRNGMSSKISTMAAQVAAIQATCAERAKERAQERAQEWGP